MLYQRGQKACRTSRHRTTREWTDLRGMTRHAQNTFVLPPLSARGGAHSAEDGRIFKICEHLVQPSERHEFGPHTLSSGIFVTFLSYREERSYMLAVLAMLSLTTPQTVARLPALSTPRRAFCRASSLAQPASVLRRAAPLLTNSAFPVLLLLPLPWRACALRRGLRLRWWNSACHQHPPTYSTTRDAVTFRTQRTWFCSCIHLPYGV